MRPPALSVVLYQQGQHYIARCLNVEVASQGRSEQEALANIHEALELYFEDDDQQDVPEVKHAKVVILALAIHHTYIGREYNWGPDQGRERLDD